jgi:hypothetical protein
MLVQSDVENVEREYENNTASLPQSEAELDVRFQIFQKALVHFYFY